MVRSTAYDANAKPEAARASKFPWLRRCILAFLSSTTFAFVFTISRLAHGEGWRHSLFFSLAEWWSWGLLAPAVVAIDRWMPFTGKQLVRRLLAHLILGPVFTIAYMYLFGTLSAALRVQPWTRLFDGRLWTDAADGLFLWSLVVYCLIVGLAEAYSYQQRYVFAELRVERLERNFSEARLNVLRMQLDPHFLFNALNTISSQVARDPKMARTMIEHLGGLLRLSLDSRSRQEIPLAEELAFLDHYLAIQKIRFGDSLRVLMRISPEVKYAAVPSLFLQPLVENAIRHGFSSRSRGGTVTVVADCLDGRLDIQVLDDGVGLPSGWSLEGRSGLGLSVTRERITALHPNGSGLFDVRGRVEGGAEVAISFPFRVMEEADERLTD
jgi:two-component system LytT family sensor kinase